MCKPLERYRPDGVPRRAGQVLRVNAYPPELAFILGKNTYYKSSTLTYCPKTVETLFPIYNKLNVTSIDNRRAENGKADHFSRGAYLAARPGR